MEEFAPLDLLLTPAGCRVNISRPVARILNRAMMLIMFTANMTTIISHYLLVDMAKEPLKVVTSLTDGLFGSAFMIIMIRSRLQIVHVLSQTSFLTPSQRRYLHRLAVFALVSRLLMLAQTAIEVTLHLLPGRSLTHILIDVINWFVDFNPWFYAAILMYTFFAKIIRFREEWYFNQLHQRLVSLDKQEQSVVAAESLQQFLVMQRKQEVRFRDSILQFFSLMPCIWFLFMFVKVCLVYEIMAVRAKTLATTVRLEELVIQVLLLCYLINTCESVTAFVRQESERTSELLVRSSRMKQLSALAAQIERSSSFTFTVWSTFDISRRFAISFLSSLITFAVLFIQMASAYRQKLAESGQYKQLRV